MDAREGVLRSAEGRKVDRAKSARTCTNQRDPDYAAGYCIDQPSTLSTEAMRCEWFSPFQYAT